MKKYYEILGLTEDATLEDVNIAFSKLASKLYDQRKNGSISRAEYAKRFDEIEFAHDTIIQGAKAKAAEAAVHTTPVISTVRPTVEEPQTKVKEEDLYDDEDEYRETGAKKVNGWKISTGVLAVALAATLALVGLKGCSKQMEDTGAYVTGRAAITETVSDKNLEEEEEIVVVETPAPTEAPQEVPVQTEVPVQAEEPAQQATDPVQDIVVIEDVNQESYEDYSNQQYIVNLGDVEDDTLVYARAQELVDQMNAAGIVNPVTTVPYTVEDIFKLIKYANGVYTPATLEEIDILHLDLLNLLISPLNTDDYLYHVVFATGNNDFNDLLNPNPTHVGFAEAFAGYGENGVYPLIQWIQQKRFDIYTSTNRDEINAIYREVGQVMADLMKGNGCTITVKDGKEAKEGITYHFTSEQVLANHSSAMILTTEAQLIFANHYEIRNELDEVVDEVPQTWEVYNKLNSDGVDENGQPIINPDIVSYEEINAWINNGCDYEWAIEAVLVDGQTFGQRIQSDMEGMAQNNYYVNGENVSLTK